MSFSTYHLVDYLVDYLVEVNSNTYNNMREELDMLFLLEHFSLEDLVKAEEECIAAIKAYLKNVKHHMDYIAMHL